MAQADDYTREVVRGMTSDEFAAFVAETRPLADYADPKDLAAWAVQDYLAQSRVTSTAHRQEN